MADTYKTADIMEACFLLARDAKMVSAERDKQSGRVSFTFADELSCKKLTLALMMGSDEVSATRFMDALRRTRKLIHVN